MLLIKLKKMKQGLIETPSETGGQKTKLTGWPAVANFFRYNYWYFIVGAFVIIFITSYVFQMVTRKEEDCLIIVNTGSINLSSVSQKYSEQFSQICPDTNKDGVPLAKVMDCSYDPNSKNAQEVSAKLLKFQAQFSINTTQLFILNYVPKS